MYLIKNNFPPGFRTLCFSCNIIDGFLRNHENLKIDGMNDLVTRLKDLAKFREKEFLQMATELTRLKVEHERLQERHNLVSDKLWKLQKGGEKDEEKIF
jgi:seryl-tRNA synthetase